MGDNMSDEEHKVGEGRRVTENQEEINNRSFLERITTNQAYGLNFRQEMERRIKFLTSLIT
jgi:hypothetical protein